MDINFTKPILDPQTYTFSFGFHQNRKVIWVHFPYSIENKNRLRKVLNARWSQTQKSWYTFDLPTNREKLGLEIEILGKEILSKIHPNNQAAFDNFINILKLKAYSPNTIRTYAVEFSQLLHLLGQYHVDQLSAEKLQSYFLYCVNQLQLSENYIHSRMNAIKFYFEKVLHRPKIFIDIPRPKKPLLLPKALNQSQIFNIINCTENLKHRLIIKICYGMGLRVSEIVQLKVQDIDSKTMKVLIARAKGKKDRYVNLPESVLEELREYYKIYRPKEYLFEGNSGGKYSIRSAQQVFKTAMKKAKIHKSVGIHTLRHSYATHLLEFGTDIAHIQKLMGHNHISTTLNYTRVTDKDLSKIKSPLDSI